MGRCKTNAPKDVVKSEKSSETGIAPKFQNQKYIIPPLFHNKWSDKNADRTLLNDTIIEFYMCEYMRLKVYDENARARYHLFHTFFYSRLRVNFGQYFKEGPPRRSEFAIHYNRMFQQKVKPSAILQKEILVIPVHNNKPKHWFLVLVHNPSGAIRRRIVDSKEVKSGNRRSLLTKQIAEYARFEEAGECRVVIMDSLLNSKKYQSDLSKAHSHAFDYIRLWLQMAASACDEELMSSRVRKVVCESLPKQHNDVDCGVYMLAYAEYFTWFNTEWMKTPTESLAYLKMEDDLKSLLNTEEPRLRLDKLFQKMKDPHPLKEGAL
ncbi:hypothetical protein GCK72_001871 [Caenorhabditis remanei]|uniref:Ubiquitin-like protease family profile domain-containing protein n=1 Tax=Caenorhabditis remanei TaxID=31234 RepID=A0A6A5HTU3_CAERE|nr:hypothetical protein GCK72_001871 [Caenorhabditis remanei]KAF1770054.1 hypothetical protein GCK72_001871 [Caenorhabditis remanei]